jgi:UDP-3-O-[3-hydroxymyristoyl] glucosamine N-acyltransferase
MEGILIHESAYVSPDAEIGIGTEIWINAQVWEREVIG